MRVLPYGEAALLLEPDDAAANSTAAVGAAVRGLDLPGVVDVVPAARTVLVTFIDPTHRSQAEAHLRHVTPQANLDEQSTLLEIPTRYGGPDLADVARRCGMTAQEVVRRHTASKWRVAFIGFAPGFAYLSGGDPLLRVPRHPDPRASVPPGSVALAGEYTAVYPRSSPGGWNLIGQTDFVTWDLAHDPPSPFRAVAHVRFVEVS